MELGIFTAITILFLLIGLAIGSFLNVVIFRIDDLKSIVATRSHCMKCRKILPWYDLIPFLSFMLLKARCRYCGEKISWQYPIVEVATGLIFAFLHFTLGLSFGLIFYLIVFSLLIVVLVYDFKTQTVPELFVWIALVFSFVGGWYFGGFSPGSALLAGGLAGAFLAALVYFSKEQWMGAGDIKIGLIMGFLVGFPGVLFALFLAFVLGSVFGLAYIYITNRAINHELLKKSLPFAPFLIFSILIAITFGDYLVNWYLTSFL